MEDYEIMSYGVAMTTLEEVFLNMNEELEPELFAGKKKDKKKGKQP